MQLETGPRTQRGRALGRGRAVTHPLRAWLRSPRAAAYLRRAGQGGRPLPPGRALPAASALRLRPTLAARSRQPLLCTRVSVRRSGHVFPAAFALSVFLLTPTCPPVFALRLRAARGADGNRSFTLGLALVLETLKFTAGVSVVPQFQLQGSLPGPSNLRFRKFTC